MNRQGVGGVCGESRKGAEMLVAPAIASGMEKRSGAKHGKRGCAPPNVPMGPHSSMGSPMTFMIRPRVARPTGICDGRGRGGRVGFAFRLVFCTGIRALAGTRSNAVTIRNTHLNRASRVDHALSANETFGGVHGNRADSVLAEVLRDLEHEPDLVALHCGDEAGWDGSENAAMSESRARGGGNSRVSIAPGVRRVPSRADMMGGSSPSNCTSTTAPITWVTRPSAAAFAAAAAANPRAKEASGLITRLAMERCVWPTSGKLRANPAREIPVVADRRACLERLPVTREKRLMVMTLQRFLLLLEGCLRDQL